MLAAPLQGSVLGSPHGFALAEWTEEPCPSEGPRPVAPLHLHVDCDEAWVVLEGTLVIQAGTDEVVVRAGDAFLVPKGTPHTYWNPSPELCRYLLVMTATTRRLIEAIHAAEDRSSAAMRTLFEAHGARLL